MTIDYHKFQEAVKAVISQEQYLPKCIDALDKKGAQVYLVGGTVRDILLGRQPADIDIEVHRLSLDELEKTLRQFGPVSHVGKSFGVLKVAGSNIDWSIPRQDSAGRKPQVELDPHLSPEQAFSRRDLTINAMGINLVSFELIDPFGGMKDLERGILRSPDIKKFQEDPLRFYRVMQFISRFGFQPDEELANVCKKMNISKVSLDRIETEFEKMFLKSLRPSLGLRWLAAIGRIHEILPELAQTIDIQQNPEYHPEGDVFEHSMQAVDAAADYEYESTSQALKVIMGALCHDLGKTKTTQIKKGRITSYEHDIVGAPLAKKMLKRISKKKELIEIVSLLVRHHMAPPLFICQKAKAPAFKRLAKKLAPLASMRLLGLVSLADRRGRNGENHLPLPPEDPEVLAFFDRARELNILDIPEEPLLQGRDLIDNLPAGKKLGDALKYAYELQIDDDIKDKAELKKIVLRKFSS